MGFRCLSGFFGGFKEFPDEDAKATWIFTEASSSFKGSIGGVHLQDSLQQAKETMIKNGCRVSKVIKPSKYGEPYDVLPGDCGPDRLIVGLENDRVINLKIADRSIIIFPRH